MLVEKLKASYTTTHMQRHSLNSFCGLFLLSLIFWGCSGSPPVRPVEIDASWEFYQTKENPSVLLVRRKERSGQFFYQLTMADPTFLGRYLIWDKGKRPAPLGRQTAFEKTADEACTKNDQLSQADSNMKSSYVLNTADLVDPDSLIELINYYFPQAKPEEETFTNLLKNPGLMGATQAEIRRDQKGEPIVVSGFIDCRDPAGRRFAYAQARSYATDATIAVAQYIKQVIRYKRVRGSQFADSMKEKDIAVLNGAALRFMIRGLRSYAHNQDLYAAWLRTNDSIDSLERFTPTENLNAHTILRDLTRLNGERSDQLVRSMEIKYILERKKFSKAIPKLDKGKRLDAKDLKVISING